VAEMEKAFFNEIQFFMSPSSFSFLFLSNAFFQMFFKDRHKNLLKLYLSVAEPILLSLMLRKLI
jgi:hypothetical protein